MICFLLGSFPTILHNTRFLLHNVALSIFCETYAVRIAVCPFPVFFLPWVAPKPWESKFTGTLHGGIIAFIPKPCAAIPASSTFACLQEALSRVFHPLDPFGRPYSVRGMDSRPRISCQKKSHARNELSVIPCCSKTALYYETKHEESAAPHHYIANPHRPRCAPPRNVRNETILFRTFARVS